MIFFTQIYGEALPVDEKLFVECQKELGISEGNKDESKLRCLNSCLLKKSGSVSTVTKNIYAFCIKFCVIQFTEKMYQLTNFES